MTERSVEDNVSDAIADILVNKEVLISEIHQELFKGRQLLVSPDQFYGSLNLGHSFFFPYF